MAKTLPTPDERISTIRTMVALRSGYMSAKILSLPWTYDPELETACTDGKSIRFGKILQTETDEELFSTAIHEGMHLTAGHHLREAEAVAHLGMDDILDRGSSPAAAASHQLANQAGDYSINGMMEDFGIPIGKGWLRDRRFDGSAFEGIMGTLWAEYKENPPPPPGPGQPQDGTDGPGGFEPMPGENGEPMTPEERERAIRDNEAGNVKAAEVAKMCGDASMGVRRILQMAARSRVNWKEVITEVCHSTAREDYSWMRPSRAHLWSGLVLPSLRSPGTPKIGVCLDMSGSVSAEEGSEFVAEIAAAISQCGCEAVCCSFDTEIYTGPESSDPGEILAWIPEGGGGTDFTGLPAWMVEHAPDVQAVIVLTDLYGPEPNEADLPCRWVWVCNSDHAPAQCGETHFMHPEKRV